MTPAIGPRATRVLTGLAVALLVVMVPVFLVTSNLRLVINGDWLYRYAFQKYQISARTGMTQAELLRVAREIRAYFNNDEELLNIRAVIYGVERPLYNQREVLHMRDVKGLVRGVYLWQQVALGYLVTFMLLGLVLRRRQWFFPIMYGLMAGGLATVALLLLVGAGSLVAFSGLFLRFHLISFSNNLWMLDPRTDYLIRMFPEGFFRDATLLVAGLSLGQALALCLLVGGLLISLRRGWGWRRSSPPGWRI